MNWTLNWTTQWWEFHLFSYFSCFFLPFYYLKRLYATYLVNSKRDSRCPFVNLGNALWLCFSVCQLITFYIKKHSCQPISWVQGTLMAVTTICKFIQAFLIDEKGSVKWMEHPGSCRGTDPGLIWGLFLIVIPEQVDETIHRMCSSALLKKYSMRNC